MITKQKIIQILKQYNITYWTEGKNVSKDSVNLQCPFCNDTSNHLGIFEGSGVFSCWKCGKSGPLVYLLQKLTGLPDEECQRIVGVETTFKEDATEQIKDMIHPEQSSTKVGRGEIGLPKFFESVVISTDFPLLSLWMERRGITLDTLVEHQCGICRVGKYMNRLIIPVIYEDRVVSFQACDLTGRANLKYATADNEVNEYLYNYDNIDKRMIVTEGVLDCWRVGKDAVCTFGTHVTEQQYKLILDKKLDELIIFRDFDAYWKSREEARWFMPFIKKVGIAKFPSNEDPDSFGKKYGREALLELISQTNWM